VLLSWYFTRISKPIGLSFSGGNEVQQLHNYQFYRVTTLRNISTAKRKGPKKQEAVRVHCSINAFVLRKTLHLVFSLAVIELREFYRVDC